MGHKFPQKWRMICLFIYRAFDFIRLMRPFYFSIRAFTDALSRKIFAYFHEISPLVLMSPVKQRDCIVAGIIYAEAFMKFQVRAQILSKISSKSAHEYFSRPAIWAAENYYDAIIGIRRMIYDRASMMDYRDGDDEGRLIGGWLLAIVIEQL